MKTIVLFASLVVSGCVRHAPAGSSSLTVVLIETDVGDGSQRSSGREDARRPETTTRQQSPDQEETRYLFTCSRERRDGTMAVSGVAVGRPWLDEDEAMIVGPFVDIDDIVRDAIRKFEEKNPDLLPEGHAVRTVCEYDGIDLIRFRPPIP